MDLYINITILFLLIFIGLWCIFISFFITSSNEKRYERDTVTINTIKDIKDKTKHKHIKKMLKAKKKIISIYKELDCQNKKENILRNHCMDCMDEIDKTITLLNDKILLDIKSKIERYDKNIND